MSRFQGTRIYKRLNPSQQEDVDRWVPIMLLTRGLRCCELKEFCRVAGFVFKTLYPRCLKWRRSRGDFLSQVRDYRNTFSLKSISPFFSVSEAATTCGASTDQVRYACRKGKLKGAFKDVVLPRHLRMVWFIPRYFIENMWRRADGVVGFSRVDRPRSSTAPSVL